MSFCTKVHWRTAEHISFLDLYRLTIENKFLKFVSAHFKLPPSPKCYILISNNMHYVKHGDFSHLYSHQPFLDTLRLI